MPVYTMHSASVWDIFLASPLHTPRIPIHRTVFADVFRLTDGYAIEHEGLCTTVSAQTVRAEDVPVF